MEKMIDMIGKWEPFGQGIFFLMVIGITSGTISELWKHCVVLVRGWPNQNEEEEEDEGTV